jgi:hypothetical protein
MVGFNENGGGKKNQKSAGIAGTSAVEWMRGHNPNERDLGTIVDDGHAEPDLVRPVEHDECDLDHVRTFDDDIIHSQADAYDDDHSGDVEGNYDDSPKT